jgi:Protein of unknown function (DUF3489)
MSKSAKKAASRSTTTAAKAAQLSQNERKPEQGKSGSKQSHVIAMLRSPAGATIDAMMKATDWQQHSVRGFLAGVVRKRLNLKLSSEKVNGNRIYKIKSSDAGKPSARAALRQPA